VKRITRAKKQTMNVKKLVSQNQQKELELKDDIAAVGDAMTKQVEMQLNKESRSGSAMKQHSSLGIRAVSGTQMARKIPATTMERRENNRSRIDEA